MKVRLLTLAGVLAAASFCACNNNDDNTDTSQILNGTDSSFVMMAGMSNTAEIRAAQLADSLATDTSVVSFANTMIADHTTAQTNLKSLATEYGVTAPDSVDAMHAAMAAQLAMMSGRTFDSAYIHSQVTDHQAAIDLFNTEVNSGNNVNLKNFAATTLPKLQMHLDSANSIASRY